MLCEAGIFPQCKQCMGQLTHSAQLTDTGVYLKCEDCYKSVIWNKEVRGKINKGDINWCWGVLIVGPPSQGEVSHLPKVIVEE